MSAGRIGLAPGGGWALLGAVIAMSVAIVGALLFVILISFYDFGSKLGGLTLGNYVTLFDDPQFWPAAVNTCWFALVTVSVAALIGTPMAWLVEWTDFPGKTFVRASLTAVLVIPGYLTAMGWLYLLHPRIGAINIALMEGFGFESAPLPLNSIFAMGCVEGLLLAPVFFVMTAGSFSQMDATLEDAAAMSGAGALARMRRVLLPLMLPGMLAAGITVTMIAFGTFDIPAVIGLSNRLLTFSTFVYLKTARADAGLPDYGVPAAFGALMVIAALIGSWTYIRLLQRARQFEVVSGKGYRRRPVTLKGWVWLAWALVCLYLLLSQVAPFAAVALQSFQPYPAPLSFASFETMTLMNYRSAPWELLWHGAWNSVVIAVVAATLVLMLSVAFAWVVLRSRVPGRFVFDAIAFMPQAIPRIVFALGALLFALFAVPDWLPLYGSKSLLIFVYCIAFISFGSRIINGSLIQIHPELEEAAHMSGAGSGTTIRRLLVPLLAPVLISAWVWLAMLCFRELTLAVLISSSDNITLPVVTWSLWNTGASNRAAAITVMQAAVLLPLVALFLSLGHRATRLKQL